MHAFRIIVAALTLVPALAHPGHDVRAEAAIRRDFLATHTNNLDHCASIHKASGLDLRNMARRSQLRRELSKRKGINPRQLSSINKSHKSDKPYTPMTDHKTIFSGKAGCVLTPQATEGPFYVTGEAIRSKVVDTERGIPLHLDIQLVDVATCQPIKGQFVEMWNANSTGVYSGANALVNGVGMSDLANLNKGFLRGAQMTDDDGVAQFETIFPGHYAGRATHVHVMTHLNAKAEANDTIWHTTGTYAGQIFFDQALITAVEQTAPYTTNRQARTANSADSILALEAATSDPFFEFVHLGNDISAGVLAWYTIAVNQSFSRPIMAVAAKYKEGGKMATTNPRVPGLAQIFPGGFPTAYQPGYGPPAAAPTGKKGKGGMR